MSMMFSFSEIVDAVAAQTLHKELARDQCCRVKHGNSYNARHAD
jgi:hypothetical protein